MPKLISSCGALLLLIIGCSSVPKRAGELATDEQRATLQFRVKKELGLSISVEDPMPSAALISISGALFVTKWYKFRPVSAGHPFLRFFGSNSIESVYEFLKDRIHHLGVMSFDMEGAATGGAPRIYAVNTGSFIWPLKQVSYVTAFRLAGNKVDAIDSPRYGLVELAPSTLIEANEVAEVDADRFLHFAVFTHESRHSDCSGIDRSLIGEGKMLPLSCTYGHTACKKGSGAVEGLSACDPQFWGAYSAQYVVLDAIVDSCIDCTKSTRRSLKLHAVDSANRINPLPDTLTSRIQGLLGKSKANADQSEDEIDELIAQINAFLMSKHLSEPDLTSGVITN